VTGLRLRHAGPLASLGEPERRALLDRGGQQDDEVRTVVSALIDVVRRDGDDALRALAREYDHAQLQDLEVPIDTCRAALDRTDLALVAAMDRAARNIRTVHTAMKPAPVEVESEPGIVIGRRPDPLSRIGVYAPGGRAPYPSSVLMSVIPARIAGVAEIILCTPPRANGLPADLVLAAAALAGVDRVFAVGGAGAVAAMAFGTESIPRVDKIVGPGNAWVAEAKLQVSNVVTIDSPAGPSELLVIADESAEASFIAVELLAQAEHDPRAAVVALCVGDDLARHVKQELAERLSAFPRATVMRRAFADAGAVLSVTSVADAVTFSNAYAPEHLLLLVSDSATALHAVRHAGAVFVGASSSVVFGDYMSGSNHVLPTSGYGRSWSGLSTADFMRWTSYQRVDLSAAARLAEDTARFADAEGLHAHAAAARFHIRGTA
jgi:histidinol dehydrogenase